MLTVQRELISIQSESALVEGMLEIPPKPVGMVLFAHGSGSSRSSPRNTFIANELQHVQLGTLLIDLLTRKEDEDYPARFDIALLTRRLHAATEWLQAHPVAGVLPLGLFGASTGAAAALQLAALRGKEVSAVVSRGGRPDMAGRLALAKVRAPTLLIVGGLDHTVLNLNQVAYTALHCEKRLEIVPGASHLFEEPGKLKAVATLAARWFKRYLPRPDKE